MPYSVLPANISFVRLKRLLSPSDVTTIVRWIIDNPSYVIYVWVQMVHVEQTHELLARELTEGVEAINVERVNVERVDNQYIASVLHHQEKISTYQVRAIETLKPVGDPSMLIRELDEGQTPYAAESVARIWAVNRLGGIALGCNVVSQGGEQPLLVAAPDGVLVGMTTTVPRQIQSSVIAGIAGDKKLEALCGLIDSRYKRFDDTAVSVALRIPQHLQKLRTSIFTGKKKRQHLESARQQLIAAYEVERQEKLAEAANYRTGDDVFTAFFRDISIDLEPLPIRSHQYITVPEHADEFYWMHLNDKLRPLQEERALYQPHRLLYEDRNEEEGYENVLTHDQELVAEELNLFEINPVTKMKQYNIDAYNFQLHSRFRISVGKEGETPREHVAMRDFDVV